MATPAKLELGGIHLKRTAVSFKGVALLGHSFQALGIIYSDLGTSPLYVLNGIWAAGGDVPSQEDVIGGISAIIWSLTLIPLIKYICVALQFGTQEGEGGSFALYQGLYPPEEKDFDADRTLTGDSYTNQLSSRDSGSSRMKTVLKWPLLVWCLFGTALTMSDGAFTPAVSVTSAVGGIGVAKESVKEHMTPISIAILVALFLPQQFGTNKLGILFGPISLIWFLLLAGTGIYNITTFPGIFRAFDPSRAVMLFVRTGNYDLLSGILLCVTGSEAIFANLGQFNALSIRLSFSCLVYPSLVLAYLGQGSRLIVDGQSVLENVFYRTIPGPVNGGLFWVVFVFAILSAIIASQAMISATFNLAQQLVNMKSLPPIRMTYTSETVQGQVYLSAVNWTLMVAVIVIVAAFTDLAAMTNAYGFAVATVMLSTAILLSVQMLFVKKWPWAVALGFFLFYGFIDGLFWGAALKKVPHGAWVPLLMGVVLASIMFLWTWAKALEDGFDGVNRYNLRHFIYRDIKPALTKTPTELTKVGSEIDEGDDSDSEAEVDYYYLPSASRPSQAGDRAKERNELVRIPTCAVFHKIAQGSGVPHSFIGLIRQWPALPRVLIFLSVSVVSVARVPPEQRYSITKVRSIEGFYGITYYLGFRDEFDVKISEIIEKICDLEMQLNPNSSGPTIKMIRSVAVSSTHIVPHYHVVSKKINTGKASIVVNYLRKYLIEDIYRRLATMFPDTANWLTPADEIIHVGINAVI